MAKNAKNRRKVSTRKHLGSAAALALATTIAVPKLLAVTDTWNLDANGSWGSAANWLGGTVPNGVDDVANITNNISAVRTVTLDGSRILGTLRVGDADGTAGFAIAAVPTGGSLTFDVSTGSALLDFSSTGSVANTFTVPMILNDDLRIAVTGSSTALHVLNGSISDGVGSRAVTIDAGGTHPSGTPSTIGQIQLNGFNTFSGGLTVDQVRVQAANAFALGTGTVTVRDGGQIYLTAATSTFNNNFVLNGLGWNESTHGQLGVIRSDQNVTLNGTITLGSSNVRLAGTGNTTVINGTISESVAGANLDIGRWLPPGGAAANATWVINSTTNVTGTLSISSGTLRVGNGGVTGDINSFSSVVFGLSNTGAEAASTATLAFNRSDNYTFTRSVSEPANGTSNKIVGSLIHAGNGVLTWDNGSSGYTGTTAVSGTNGRLVFGSGGAYSFTGTGNITLSNGADLQFNTSSDVDIGSGTKPAAQTLGGAAGSYLIQSGSGTITLGGTVDNSGARLQVNSGTVVLAKSSTSAIHALGGGGDLGLVINGGTVRLAGSGGDQLVDGTAIRLSGGTLDLNGTNESIDVLTGAGGTITNTNSTGSVMTIGAGNSAASISENVLFAANYGGVIANGAGTVALTKNGTGLQVLAGTNTYSGPTTINGGTLAVTGSLANGGAVIVNTGATLSGTGTVGNVTLTSGSNLRPGANAADISVGSLNLASLTVLGGDLRFNLGATNDRVVVAGATSFTTAATVTPTFSTPPALGTVTLLASSALTLTTPPTLAGIPALTRSTFALTNTATDLQLSITGLPAQTLTWSGTNGGNWDLAGSTNFNAGVETFFNLDAVIFGDGPTARTVTLAAGLNPSSVTVNNSTGNDYVFQTGSLTGGGTSIAKSGNGMLTLSTANTFSGPVTITGGTLRAGNAAALGDTNGQTFVSNGGTLDVNGQNLGAEFVNVSGAGVNANGAIVNTGGGQNNAFRFLRLTGDTTFGGTGRFDIRSNGGGEILDLGGFTLTKAGTNQFSIVGVPIVTDGSIVANSGILSIETTTVIRGAGTITYNPGATAQFFQSVAANVTRPMIWNGNFVDPAGTTTGVGSSITLAGDVTFQGTGTLTLTGNIAETGASRSVTKNGSSTDILTGNVNYTGATTVNGGTLQIGNGLATALPNTSGISLSGGGLLNFSAIANANFSFPITIASSGGTLRWTGGNQASTLTISNTVGSGFGSLSVAQGTVTLASGANVNVGSLDVGRTSPNTNNIGTLNILPGTTVTIASNFFIGESATGLTGIVNQSGGDVVVNGTDNGVDGSFRIGHWSGQGSSYNISGGTLTALNCLTSVGIDGVQPVLNISGGMVRLRRLNVDGRAATGPIGGILKLSGGTLAISEGGLATTGNASMSVSGGILQAFNIIPLTPTTWAVGMSLENNTPKFDTNGVNVTLSGAANGPGGFTKVGEGTLAMTNTNNNLDGTVNVEAGALQLTGNLTGGATLNVKSGGKAIVAGRQRANATTNVNSGGVLAGAGDGVSTGILGNLVVSAGATLRPGLSVTDGSVGTLTATGLTFAGNAAFDLTPGVFSPGGTGNDLLVVTGTATFNGGTITPVFAGAPIAGTYTLITSSGLAVNTAPTLSFGGATRMSFALQQNANNYELAVSGTAFNLTWSGDGTTNNWDVNTTQNWKRVTANDEKFLSYDNVTFDGTGSTNPNVNIAQSVFPGTTTVNSSTNYTFSGAGGIGSGSLTKTGTGTLTLLTNNSFPGGTTIDSGVLQLGNGGATGSLGSAPIINDGTLVINRTGAVTMDNIISGAGGVRVAGGGNVTLSASNSYGGGTVVSAGNLILGNASAAGSGAVTLGDANTGASATGFFALNGQNPFNDVNVAAGGTGLVTIGSLGGTAGTTFSGTMTFNRAVTLQAIDTNFTGFSGRITGSAGLITLIGGRRVILQSTANDFASDILLNEPNTILQSALSGGSPETIPDGASITMTSGTTFQLGFAGSGTETMNALNGTGTVQLVNATAGTTHTLALGSAGGSGTFNGTVQNGAVVPFSLAKLGAGTQTMTGAVNSTGSITVSGGVFAFGNVFGVGATKAALTTDTTLDNTLTVASGVVTNDLVIGMSVTGTGVPAGSRITSIPSSTTVTIAGTQTATLAGNLTFGAAPMFLSNGGTFRYTGAARADDRLINIDVTGGALDASGTGALTLSGSPIQLTNSGPRTLTLTGTSTAANALSGIIADSGGATTLNKTGTGTWVLSGVNTYTGGTNITAGVLRIGGNNKPVGDAFAVTVSNGGTFDVNGQTGATATRRYDLTISGAGVPGQAAIWNSGVAVVNNPIYRSITLTGDASIGGVNRYDLNGGSVDGAGVAFNGGTFTLTKEGPSECWWSPQAGATIGSIVVNAGTFGVQSSFNLGTDSLPIIINPNGTLNTYGGQTNTKDVVINGGILATNNNTNSWNGNVTLNGAGTTNRIAPGTGLIMNIGGKLSGTGFEKLNNSTLELQSGMNDWFGDTKVTAGILQVSGTGIISPNTTLDMNGGTVNLNGTQQTVAGLKGATGTVTDPFGGTLTINQSSNTSFGGAISGVLSVVKGGAGTLTLSGTNDTTGATTVNTGGLVVNGSLSGSAIAVNSGATLGGSGTVGSVNLLGGVLAPGTSAGTLTTGPLSLDATSVVKLELAQAGVIGNGINDLLSVVGDLVLDGTLQVTELPGFTEGTYRLFNYTGILDNRGLLLDPAFLAVHPGSTVNVLTAGQVNLVVVPEPGSLTAILVAAAGAVGLSRRRKLT